MAKYKVFRVQPYSYTVAATQELVEGVTLGINLVVEVTIKDITQAMTKGKGLWGFPESDFGLKVGDIVELNPATIAGVFNEAKHTKQELALIASQSSLV